MHFSEYDLRAALKRKDPGAGFTQRVMARVNQAESKAEQPERKRTWWWSRMWSLHPVLAGALAVLLVVAAASMGFVRYQQAAQQRQEAQKARAAEQQVRLALRITNTKMNQVLQRVNTQPRDNSIRRETL